jgi:hypothetical protein
MSNYSTTVSLLLGIEKNTDYDKPEIIEYRKKVDMISHLTSDDPEIWMANIKQPALIPIHTAAVLHHPYFVRELMEKADEVGVPYVAYYGNPIIYEDPSGEGCKEYLKRKLSKE